MREDKYQCGCYACVAARAKRNNIHPTEIIWIVKFRAPSGDNCLLELVAPDIARALSLAHSMLDIRCTINSIQRKG